MAIYRKVHTRFWSDRKVLEEFSSEEKYLFLYLMTNPHTNLAGCYEIGIKQIAFEVAMPEDDVRETLASLTEKCVIDYSNETGEVLIIHWHKHNWTGSDKFRKPLLDNIHTVKNEGFRDYLMVLYQQEDYTVSIQYPYDGCEVSKNTISVTVTNTVTNTNTDIDKDKDIEVIREVIDYLNQIIGTHYTTRNKETRKHIKARLNDGATLDDFKTVIYKKAQEWKGTEFEKFLRPQTLFGTKFESYLNQTESEKKGRLDWLNDLPDMDTDCQAHEVNLDTG